MCNTELITYLVEDWPWKDKSAEEGQPLINIML